MRFAENERRGSAAQGDLNPVGNWFFSGLRFNAAEPSQGRTAASVM